MMIWIKKLVDLIKRKKHSIGEYSLNKTTCSDWIEAIDQLLPLILQARTQYENSHFLEFDFEAFEAGSYLYQLHKLVLKAREYIFALQCYEFQYADKPDIIEHTEFVNSNQASLDCYHTIMNMLLMFKRSAHKENFPHELLSQMQLFEIELVSLRSAIRILSQFIQQYESNLKLTQLERNLLLSLSESYHSIMKGTESDSALQTSSETIKQNITQLPSLEDQKLLISVVQAYDTLSKCYVISQKQVIKQTLEHFYFSICYLVEDFNKIEVNKTDVLQHLQAIFNDIESLRFSCHREGRCSRQLFERAKNVKHHLRHSCAVHPIAKDYHHSTGLRRIVLLAQSPK